jgi:hypothetical protein
LRIPAYALLLLAASCNTVCLSSVHAREDQPSPQTFTLKESFGVSHPSQIVDFDLMEPIEGKPVHLIGPDGSVVPFQLLKDNKLVLQTDLPANRVRTWKLLPGKADPQSPIQHPVAISRTDSYYEISNGLTGVRIPRAEQALNPTPAPVQGIRCRDGQWTATGPNYLSLPARSLKVDFLEEGPLKVVVKLSYVYDRAEVTLRGQMGPGGQTHFPGGEGFYRSTLTLEAGRPSILFEEDADVDLSYSLNVYAAVHPTQARYRGHHATSAARGREPDGGAYRPNHERRPLDAEVDLSYAAPEHRPPMAVWDPWLADSGYYWQLYDPRAAAPSNLLGIFAGPASRALGAPNSGVQVDTAPVGVTDLVSQVDAAGNVYVVYQSDSDLWYQSYSASLQPEAPQKLGSEVIHPDLQIGPGGQVSIVAYSEPKQQFVRWQGDPHKDLVSQPIDLGSSSSWSVTDPVALQASSEAGDFLLLTGFEHEKRALLLFARPKGESAWRFQQAVPVRPNFNRPTRTPELLLLYSCWRPVLTRLTDGRVVLVYADPGGYAEVATIAPGALNFGELNTRNSLVRRHQILSFGQAIDPRTGNILVADDEGGLVLLKPDEERLAGQRVATRLRLRTGARDQGPNRRTLASDGQGTLVAEHGDQLFLFQEGQWAPFQAANQLHLASARVAFHAATGQFVLLGRQEGKLSLYTWRLGDSTPRLRQQQADTERSTANFTIALRRFTGDTRFFPRVRFSWGLFAGVRGTDLKPPQTAQPIAEQMDYWSIMNLSKLHRYQLEFPDPPGGYGGLYMDKKIIQQMVERLRRDRRYAADIYDAEPSGRTLVEVWKDSSVDGHLTREAAADVQGLARRFLEALVHGDGVYDFRFHYWMGGLEMSRRALLIDAILASPRVSAKEKAQLKAAAALFAYVLWDNDFVPLFGGHGLNLGTANMPVQQQGYRDLYAILLANHPAMQAHAQEAAMRVQRLVRHIVNEHGAAMGGTHYMGASLEPTLNTLLQLQARGEGDLFQTEERLPRLADFCLNLLTPPEVRFGGPRKLIAVGDAATESSELYGIMATGFRKVNPPLSARLQWAWVANGRPQSGFFTSTLAEIDDSAPVADPHLGNANFPGWYSVLRHGWGTRNETACWFINGDFYSDHRHQDAGSVILYALGAPVSLDWGSMYDPQTGGAYMHSLVLPEDHWGKPGDRNNPPARARRDRPGDQDNRPVRARGGRGEDQDNPPARGRGDRPGGDQDNPPARGRGARPGDQDNPPVRARGGRPGDQDNPPARGRGGRRGDQDNPPARGRGGRGGDQDNPPARTRGDRPERDDHRLHPWNQDDTPLNGGMAWGRSTLDQFLSFRQTACAQAHFTAADERIWTRTLYAIHPNEQFPIIVLDDRFRGPKAEEPKIFSLNLMAQGDVDTPQGRYTPPPRTYGRSYELPSAGPVFDLPAGLHHLGFRGQWLIDWDLYVVAASAQQAQIGNWGHNFNPNESEFRRANRRPFEEHQHILRMKGSGPFKVLLLPYRKGEQRRDLQVRQEGKTVTIQAGDEVTVIDDASCSFRKGSQCLLTLFGPDAAEANEIRAAGGPLEIFLDGDHAHITAHGSAGKRQFRLPGTWRSPAGETASKGLHREGDEWILDYSGGDPLHLVLQKP